MLTKFQTETFIFKDREAKILYPPCPANGKLILKTEYFSHFPYFEAAMLERGYTLCFISHPTRWAPDSETHIMAEFVRYVAAHLQFEEKCIPVGFSCGGLQAVRLAQLHPELISVLFLDAPVLNILSMAGLGACRCVGVPQFREELFETYGFTESTLVNFRKSPIDNLPVLIQNNIPIIMLWGDRDETVLYEENGRILEEYYRKHGGLLEVLRIPGRGHHPHSLEDPTPIIAFVESHL